MTWTPDETEAFFLLVEEAWPGDFDDGQRAAWRTLLDAYEPEQAVTALRVLLASGHRFRPSVSELIAAIRNDPSRPTFAEAYALLFGSRGGALTAGRDKIAERLEAAHPLVAAFAQRQGVDRLLMLPVNDPDWGERTRRDLEAQWDRHVEAFDGREVAAIASGGQTGLRQLDPLAALKVTPPAELEEGEAA